ncbi:uncharacterized protein LAJ45_04119 [Morchella importuna]|uniref:uncharacterized protein n=1 Tax=Morchella importuna TaxID=1174673 RepID=UPI001E8CD4A5|nr:uncharacterized protein LAJ45_04119 [Morchella importuna]KAH8151498.1 hypothetical protein LAJ45_04119 [Morchella importuna]
MPQKASPLPRIFGATLWLYVQGHSKTISIAFVSIAGLTSAFCFGYHLSDGYHRKRLQELQELYEETAVPLLLMHDAACQKENMMDLPWLDIARILRASPPQFAFRMQSSTYADLTPDTVDTMFDRLLFLFLATAWISWFVKENSYLKFDYTFLRLSYGYFQDHLLPGFIRCKSKMLWTGVLFLHRAVLYLSLTLCGTWVQGIAHRHPQSAATHDLSQAAEDASAFLTIFSRTRLGDNERFGREHQELVGNALTVILEIQRDLRLRDAVAGREEGAWPWPEGLTGLTVNAECLICYSEIVNIVLLPCGHLILCESCCDTLGIRESAIFGNSLVKCPLCRSVIYSRVKVFRG